MIGISRQPRQPRQPRQREINSPVRPRSGHDLGTKNKSSSAKRHAALAANNKLAKAIIASKARTEHEKMELKIKKITGEEKKTIVVEVLAGATLPEAIELSGETGVYAMYVAGVTREATRLVRQLCNKGETDEAIVTALGEWIPGVREEHERAARRFDPVKRVKKFVGKKIGKLSAEERARLIAALEAMEDEDEIPAEDSAPATPEA